MNNLQEFTPKYWVVHDVSTDDVLLYTASKSRDYSICLYVESLSDSEDNRGNLRYELFYENPNLECSLVELRLVDVFS